MSTVIQATINQWDYRDSLQDFLCTLVGIGMLLNILVINSKTEARIEYCLTCISVLICTVAVSSSESLLIFTSSWFCMKPWLRGDPSPGLFCQEVNQLKLQCLIINIHVFCSYVIVFFFFFLVKQWIYTKLLSSDLQIVDLFGRGFMVTSVAASWTEG